MSEVGTQKSVEGLSVAVCGDDIHRCGFKCKMKIGWFIVVVFR